MKLLSIAQPLDVLQNKLVLLGRKEKTILISNYQNIVEVQKMVNILSYVNNVKKEDEDVYGIEVHDELGKGTCEIEQLVVFEGIAF